MRHTKTWSYHHPVKISAGPGALSRLPNLVPEHGNLLLITTPGFSHRGTTDLICQQLGRQRVQVHDRVSPNPDLDDLDQAVQEYRAFNFSGIIGLGGGSVLDAAKVLGTALALDMDKPLEALLRQKQDQPQYAPIPVTAIPGTSGTGAEVTPFATVWDGKNKKKHSLTGEHVYPQQALLDPELTLSLPYQQTLHTGLDAISHALESLWNKDRTPVSEAWALHALMLANQALPLVLEQPGSLEQRSRMQQASLLAGLAISQTRTAIAHSISYPLTIRYGVPHGLACSFTLPALIQRYLPWTHMQQESQTLKGIQALLGSLDLSKELRRYLGDRDPAEHLLEMFSPERAGNFVEPLTMQDVQEILRSSASLSQTSTT
ncbi:MAG: phosphonoacetaldehyde reductase [Desulfohalobiaceae bacterium]